jgi:putative transposase
MARLPRLVIPQQPHHIVQFGVDKQTIFRESDDYSTFLNWLRDAAKQYKVAIHAYVLMPNHLHLLATPVDEDGLARMMQWVGRHYVPYFNKKYGRNGTLWASRFKAVALEASRYLLMCSHYIERNPVRSGIVVDAADYAWSSYGHHIGAKQDLLVTDHAIYWSLGNTPFERDASYRRMVEQGLSQKELMELRDTVNKGWVLGSDGFKKMLETELNRRVQPAKRGRPRKKAAVAVENSTGVNPV